MLMCDDVYGIYVLVQCVQFLFVFAYIVSMLSTVFVGGSHVQLGLLMCGDLLFRGNCHMRSVNN